MKLSFLLMAAGLVLHGTSPELGEIKTVYLLPMSSGLDQFLAIQLTAGAILQVVTDPQKADAVLTDRIGGGLEQKLDELFGEKSKKQDQDQETFGDSNRPATQPLTRGKGAIFLVDRKSRNVVWSMYARPKNSASEEMNRVAEKIASKMNRDRKGK